MFLIQNKYVGNVTFIFLLFDCSYILKEELLFVGWFCVLKNNFIERIFQFSSSESKTLVSLLHRTDCSLNVLLPCPFKQSCGEYRSRNASRFFSQATIGTFERLHTKQNNFESLVNYNFHNMRTFPTQFRDALLRKKMWQNLFFLGPSKTSEIGK